MTCFYGHPRGHVNARACSQHSSLYHTGYILKLVHYALLIYQLRFVFTFLKVLANFPIDKYGLDCGLELNAKVFQLCLNNVSRVLVLEGYDYSGHVISRHFSRSLQWLLVRNSRVYEGINGGVDKVMRVVQT